MELKAKIGYLFCFSPFFLWEFLFASGVLYYETLNQINHNEKGSVKNIGKFSLIYESPYRWQAKIQLFFYDESLENPKKNQNKKYKADLNSWKTMAIWMQMLIRISIIDLTV